MQTYLNNFRVFAVQDYNVLSKLVRKQHGMFNMKCKECSACVNVSCTKLFFDSVEEYRLVK